MSLRFIDDTGNEEFIAGGGGGNADIEPLTKEEFDSKFDKGELKDGKYYAITDDTEEGESGETIKRIESQLNTIEAVIKTDEETLPVGSGTIFGAIDALNAKLTNSPTFGHYKITASTLADAIVDLFEKVDNGQSIISLEYNIGIYFAFVSKLDSTTGVVFVLATGTNPLRVSYQYQGTWTHKSISTY